MFFLRWLIVALGLAVAAVLLLRGSYLLGLLIGALVVVRVVYLFGIIRRRRAFGVPLDASSRQVLRDLARSELVVGARLLGLDPAQARRAFVTGRSLAEIAQSSDTPLGRIVDEIVRDAKLEVDRRAAQGELTAEQASQLGERLPFWANRLVHFHRGDFGQPRRWT